ncbi:MAG: hypothetical protein A3F51_02270 [Candidatus Taylorbacteria bacterium RIFCSPHIGHO2_12_FULL_45_16]|uniref:Homing endonuclease LAGLIDADG domain-containing protein n=1 Tax=Candidatus Taylorbacteria bacterium RIFCSPHIGHO2_12_FULL_45_16 TaxID=1802315 RepID=A0A1G2MXY1_9BACT|nr:MAG: hypothetical protein A3F51_02270 [Candidatus Taylorbacteria bacterium RIFCSPHIGHO2_12_FULL_45_16]OHA32844.1 MAG: hypothetical protein A3A23_03070 [Candidatus Taylorbacteria bacterium RIFCSPLOWO2_01_FULL_45_59]OHA38233.1 MAG: hypothetical protein A3I98_02810 [Candidatus Taylorbacteria bacterium RIFCSPLOWO2_02_FULL_45_10b]OHA43955.1 MAG: hypothetical protein A3G04_00995 [Candidatus Taylorbacteria bacterium RIFCSPLOWO2_12_FULL_44_9]
MSKNASNDFGKNQRPDNPQEMLKNNFYFSGLIAAEMSCSIIKTTNKKPNDYYYMVVLTVTNADRKLLNEVNRVVMNNRGVISPVKGAYNLSARGKSKVRTALNFLEMYPIPIGDLAKNRILLLKTVLVYLESHRAHRFQKEKTIEIEELRRKLREVKTRGIVDQQFDLLPLDQDSLGYFIAGVIDGEGSFGYKSSGLVQEPFFMIAMKDKKIIELINKFVNYGNVRLRKDGVYHLEINSRIILKKVCKMFLNQYPLHHERQRKRLMLLQQLLNDYTPRSLKPVVLENVI